MRASDVAQLNGLCEAGECRELLYINLVRTAGFKVRDVGEPFQLGRNIGELLELRRA